MVQQRQSAKSSRSKPEILKLQTHHQNCRITPVSTKLLLFNKITRNRSRNHQLSSTAGQISARRHSQVLEGCSEVARRSSKVARRCSEVLEGCSKVARYTCHLLARTGSEPPQPAHLHIHNQNLTSFNETLKDTETYQNSHKVRICTF